VDRFLESQGVFKELQVYFDVCYKLNKNNLIPTARLYNKRGLETLFRESGFNYSDDYYAGNNYFATFRK